MMPLITIVYASILIAMGVVGYFATGRASVTALIPAFIGIPILLTGLTAQKKIALRPIMLKIALVLAIIGAAGAFRGVSGFVSMLGGGDVNKMAVTMQTLMVVLSIGYVVLWFKKR